MIGNIGKIDIALQNRLVEILLADDDFIEQLKVRLSE